MSRSPSPSMSPTATELVLIRPGAEVAPGREVPRPVVQVHHVLLAGRCRRRCPGRRRHPCRPPPPSRCSLTRAEVAPGREVPRPVVQVHHVLLPCSCRRRCPGRRRRPCPPPPPRGWSPTPTPKLRPGDVKLPAPSFRYTTLCSSCRCRRRCPGRRRHPCPPPPPSVESTRAEVAPGREVARPVVQVHHVLLAVVAGDDVQVAVAVHVPHRHRVGGSLDPVPKLRSNSGPVGKLPVPSFRYTTFWPSLPTTMSRSPSPSMSPTATTGYVRVRPGAEGAFEPARSGSCPSRRSGTPRSADRSCRRRCPGRRRHPCRPPPPLQVSSDPVPKLRRVGKFPIPSFRYTTFWLSLSAAMPPLPTTMSRSPSPSMSPTATDWV